MDIDEPLLLFRAQYFQCLDADFLSWPPTLLLKQPDAQRFLFKYLFDETRLDTLPPAAYQFKVLSALLARIRRAVGPELLSESPLRDLASRLAILSADGSSLGHTAQTDAYITYNCIPQTSRLFSVGDWRPVTLLEPRSLVSGSRHTGHRTWEGALHLASYLLSNPTVLAGKSVLELGAGTGFLSILCAKYLGVNHVASTDGDEKVIQGPATNLKLNAMEDAGNIVTRMLLWGEQLRETWVQRDYETRPVDVVIGADIIYEKAATEALVETLRMLVDLYPLATVVLSNAVRFPAIFELFRRGCERNRLSIREIDYQMTPAQEQKSLFYSTAIPLQIIEIQSM